MSALIVKYRLDLNIISYLKWWYHKWMLQWRLGLSVATLFLESLLWNRTKDCPPTYAAVSPDPGPFCPFFPRRIPKSLERGGNKTCLKRSFLRPPNLFISFDTMDVGTLSATLQATVSPDPAVRRPAEDALLKAEQMPGYGTTMLNLIVRT